MRIYHTQGDKSSAMACCEWQPMWDANDLSDEALTNPPDEFHVM